MSNDLHRAIDRLTVRNAELVAENKYLRRIAKDTKHGRILRRTLADAKTLLVWRFSGIGITRRNAGAMGMSERRWGYARGLLLLARIHDGQDLAEGDFDACNRAIEAAGRRLERDGLERLHLRMARNGR